VSRRQNNFDLIRLFAALQVVFLHGFGHLAVPNRSIVVFLNYFSGVPIFFVISGFLISMSWERAPSLRQYAWNRALRLYPGMWLCLLLSIVLFLACGTRPDSLRHFGIWLLAQTTVIQFYNPDFLRGFGSGVLNGSLWTIPVEIQFYGLLPLLALAAKRRDSVWLGFWAAAAALLILSAAATPRLPPLPVKLLGVSLIPWLFYFLTGCLGRRLYERRPALFEGKFPLWAAAYAAWIAIEIFWDIPGRNGRDLNVPTIILLAMLAISGAFSKPALASALLRGNDISYGVYLYHIPIINLLLFRRMTGAPAFLVLLAAVIAAAAVSWRLIERPALALKNYSLFRRDGRAA
jgi:peptidoglycan/LPS O-acetylase OafA/YrhL